jgi:ribose transport system substrate-binding protein
VPAGTGRAGVEQAIAALKGEPVQKKIGTGFVVVTKDNMNDPDVKPFLYKSTC